MKKLIFTLTFLMSVLFANAQIATENSKVFDNIGIGATVGTSTPLDFSPVFPLNINIGIKGTKDITPVFGAQLEAFGIFNSNHLGEGYTAIDAFNLNANLSTNLFNAIKGYKGIPRIFELNMITGLGWIHTTSPVANNFIARTGLDLVFNIGKKRAHSIVITPAINWNLSRPGNFKFSKSTALLGVNLSYIYHFKNSNGTHYFNLWDIGLLNSENESLRNELNQTKERLQRVPKVIERVVTETIEQNAWVVQFSQGSSELTDEAKTVLKSINGVAVDVVGIASPEGTPEFNQRLSEKRAAVVADYLTKQGVKVVSYSGKGVQYGESTNRLAIITIR